MANIFSTLLLFLCSVALCKESIAVHTLLANNLSQNEEIVITDLIRSEISKLGLYDVMERSQMNEIINEQGLQQLGLCENDSCAIEIGKLLSVNNILIGSLGLVNEIYALNFRIVNISTGKIIHDVNLNFKGNFDKFLNSIIPKAVKKIGKSDNKTSVITVSLITSCTIAAVIVPFVYSFVTSDEKVMEDSNLEVRAKW